ncbi:MAG: redoxin domain-containing protein [Deltaproteobacteria bacterium]|nr:redoxin domain-containing protein [Deltaproteobacteria bacterium]
MKLSEMIWKIKASRQVPPEVAEIMKRGREKIRASGAAGLSVGERAPDFTLTNQVGKTVHLADRLAAGPVVLSFYRGEW